jgi:hypothetical protein
MTTSRFLLLVLALALFAGCATTRYKPYETKNNLFEGRGGTKEVVDGMEVWDNGDPPRRFKVLGIIEDKRPGGIIPMSALAGDMVRKAREAGGDAIVQLSNESQITGYYTSGSASAYSYGGATRAYGTSTTMPVRRNVARFAVIKYVD